MLRGDLFCPKPAGLALAGVGSAEGFCDQIGALKSMLPSSGFPEKVSPDQEQPTV